MAVIGDAYIEVHPDLDGFGRNINRGISGIARKAAGIFAAAFVAGRAFDFVGDALAEAREAAKVADLTEAVIKSTGGAANVSQAQLGALSDRLSVLAAVDDEVIQSAGNVLLTFTKVRNEVGAGNAIFDRATEGALNMSAALGTDLQGAVLQVGKALNDPIKGVTALTRAGVSFTQQQKDQIKALQQSGDMLGAQKIILGELETQFGGAAEAAADPMARLGVVVGNLKERLGTALLPTVERVSIWLGNNLPGYMDKASSAFRTVRDAVAPLVGAVQEAYSILASGDFRGVGPWAEDSGIVDTLFDIREAVVRIVGAFRDDWLPVIQEVAGWVGDNLQPVLIAVGAVLLMLTSPLAAVAAAVIYAYTHFQVVSDVLGAVLSFITGTVVPGISGFVDHVRQTFSDAVAWTQQYWGQISEAIGHVVRVIRTVVETALGAIAAFWRAWGDDLLSIAGTLWNYIRETIDNAVQLIQGIIRTVLAVINGDWGKAWEGIKQAVGAVWDQIGNIISTAAGIVRGLIGGVLSSVQEMWGTAWGWVAGHIASIWGTIIATLTTKAGELATWFIALPGKLVEWIGDIAGKMAGVGWDIIRGLVKGIKDAAEDILESALDWVTDKIPDWKGPMEKDRRLLQPTGKTIMLGLVEGIRAGAGDVQTYLRAVSANIVSTVQAGVGNLRALAAMPAARRSLADAERALYELKARDNALPAEIAAAEAALKRAQADAEFVNLSEQLRIAQAEQAVIDKTEELERVRKDGESTALDLKIATLELRAANAALSEAQREAVAPTDAVTEAERRLIDLRAEEEKMARSLTEATEAVRAAELGVVDAHMQVMTTGAQVAGDRSVLTFFADMAREAGLTEASVRTLVDTIGNLPNKVPDLEAAADRVESGSRNRTKPKPGAQSGLRDRVAAIGEYVGETWSGGKIDRIVEQIGKGQRDLDSVAEDVARRVRGKAVPDVVYASIDTPKLLERMNIQAAVGDAIKGRTRLRPVTR